ncbi:MAG TPA: energy-coupling factor transporter transmembrane component T [Acidimicrobiales bacterium]|nr:energy-coupling factor transporter transmembrane component T [Acidimicrobiales bacterium]
MSLRLPTASARRGLHPAAWWLWAGCMAGAAIRTTNPILLALIASVAAFVVSAKRTSAPWSRSLVVFFRLGIVVIVVRVVIQIIFGNRLPGHVLFTLPEIPLPSWAQGVSIGGPVTVEAVVQAAVQGLRLAVVLICFGAANSLASPYRLLRCLPAVLYEAGVAVTVSLAFAPEVVMAIAGVRDARRLRGRPIRGLAGLRGMAIPVLESALDRSLQLASSMDARGYGRRIVVPQRTRWMGSGGTAVGLLLVIVGVYGVLDTGSLPAGGIPFLAVGAVLIGAGMAVGGRRTNRTRYRPDVWRIAEWVVGASGAAALSSMIAAAVLGVPGLQLQVYPLEFPPLPLLPAAGILIGLLPALVAPTDRSVSGARTTAPPTAADEAPAPAAPASAAPAPAATVPTAAVPPAAQRPAPIALRAPLESAEGTVA